MKTEKDYEDLRVLDARIKESGVPLGSLIRIARVITLLQEFLMGVFMIFCVLSLILMGISIIGLVLGSIWLIGHKIYTFFQGIHLNL